MRDYRPQAEKNRFEKLLQSFAQTRFGGSLFLVASKAGSPRHPAWLHNVRAHPDVEVTIEVRRRPMRAEIASGAARERFWHVVCDNYSGYATYQRRAGHRLIPVVALAPR